MGTAEDGSGNAAELATYVVEKGQAPPHAGRVSAGPACTQSSTRPAWQEG
jgi:hypothetical protein